MGAFERVLPLALTVFCGVVGGYYTFQPVMAAEAVRKDPLLHPELNADQQKNPAPSSK
ncbi:hypothetical protein B0T10DRAFT_496855 [Thelonectria olida]|uniref:Uncharacterized protein n=1 Tax=Thelonectria olida TaxID=1576542 RepID=A0A9P9AMI0_9HYPO|nr:hypothetical protein B0T10DRAFT_496855 [Thelonectria olida]